MDRLIKVNGKTYKAAEFDVNFMCDLEDNHIKFEEIKDNMFKLTRMYVAISMDTDVKTAGKEMTEHMKNGGDLEDIYNVMSEMMDESDFFRSKQENKDQANSTRAKKKKESEEVIS